MNSCVICDALSRADAVPGGPLEVGELVQVYHSSPPEGATIYPGHLMVVPHRHADDFAALTPDEPASVGRAITRWSRALKDLGATRVYVATIGHVVAHLHVHLVPRWVETPAEVRWHEVDEWPGGRRVNYAELEIFVEALRAVG